MHDQLQTSHVNGDSYLKRKMCFIENIIDSFEAAALPTFKNTFWSVRPDLAKYHLFDKIVKVLGNFLRFG